MIEIYRTFIGWKEVNIKDAQKFVEFLHHNITAMSGETCDKYINENRLRGTTVNELFPK